LSYLLDTHVLLWWLADDPRLSDRHRTVLARSDSTVYVSAISVAEIAIKSSIGKLSVPDGVQSAISEGGFDELAFMSKHATALASLPWIHRDPFDRMLVSQASVEGLVFLTEDERCKQYDISTL